MAADPSSTLFIVYNADGSVMGKVQYAYRKVTSAKDAEAVCAACDITHGGLSLSETPAWVQAKGEIEASSNLKVVQWHRNELAPELKEFVENNHVALPVAIVGKGGRDFEVVMDRPALASCNGDPAVFVKRLREMGLLT